MSDLPTAKRRRRGCLTGLATVILGWVGPVLGGCMNLSTPVDHLLNWGNLPHDEQLEAPGERRLIVLQHGLARSSASLAKLARALRGHGYEVLNTSYKSYSESVEQASARLAKGLAKHPWVTSGEPFQVAFVGHSMGGLVVRRYLARDDALDPYAVVFLGTPQRGAQIVDAIGERWYYRLFMGRRSALELHPESGLFNELADPTEIEGCRVGVVLGKTGRPGGRTVKIPGDDDGRVGVSEARLVGAEHLELEVGHTSLTTRNDVLSAVLSFLERGTFGT